jgi:VanZ family protein
VRRSRRSGGAGEAARGAAGAGAWLARDAWQWWALLIVVGGVLPVAQIFGWAQSDAWSPVASAVHTFEFAVFAILVATAWRWRVPGSTGMVPAAVLSLVLGALVEVIQGPLPYRDFSLGDLAFDVAGVAIGLVVLSAARRLRDASGWFRTR